MPASANLLTFIRSSFRSVWSIELLLLLKQDPERCWTPGDLVAALRGSDSVVSQSIDALVSAGLVATAPGGEASYAPASPAIKALADEAVAYYAKRPDEVRRIIVTAGSDQLRAFSDAFRLRKG